MTSEFVDVWLGRFESEAALAAYLEETYSEDDEAAPISRFAADQGQRSYDHDFVESDFFAETADLAAALDGFSYARAYLADVVAAYRAQAAPPPGQCRSSGVRQCDRRAEIGFVRNLLADPSRPLPVRAGSLIADRFRRPPSLTTFWPM